MKSKYVINSSLDNIQSHVVLECENDICRKEIESLVSLKQAVPDTLKDRKIQIENRLESLDVLFPDIYLKHLKDKIIETKKYALIFKKAGNISLAKRAMLRIKIMEQEISESEDHLGMEAMNLNDDLSIHDYLKEENLGNEDTNSLMRDLNSGSPTSHTPEEELEIAIENFEKYI